MSNSTRDFNELELQMADYYDGTLRGKDLVTFEQSLEQNAEFRKHFEQYRRTVQALQGLPKERMSEFGRARLRRALQKQQNRRQPVQRFYRPLSYAAAAVLLMSIGFVTGQQFQETQPGTAYQALPVPDPQVRLRDASTGGWMNVDDFAAHIKRTRQSYAVIPQLRISADKAQARVDRGQNKVQEALERQDIDLQSVQFFAPVRLNENPLDGPEVEFWVQKVGLGNGQ